MTRSMLVLLVALLTAACGQAVVPVPVAPVPAVPAYLESAPVQETKEEAKPEVTCEPCDVSCLDAAEAESDPAVAHKLAAQACDIEACGYVGTTSLLRCKSFGFLADASVVGPMAD